MICLKPVLYLLTETVYPTQYLLIFTKRYKVKTCLSRNPVETEQPHILLLTVSLS